MDPASPSSKSSQSSQSSPASPALLEIAEVARLRSERDHLEASLARAEQQVAEQEQRVAAAAAQVQSEQADVEALQSWSMTRILAGVRGRRDTDLEREQAEAAAAVHAHAGEQARLDVARREEAHLRSRLTRLGALDARWKDALAAREREVDAGSAEGVRLGEVAAEVGRLTGEHEQLDEALVACQQAEAALAAAAVRLGKAKDWATYDVWFDNGMVSDMLKHQRLEEAQSLVSAADASLARLGAELADVGVAPVGEVRVEGLNRTLDVWFDNIFTDVSVASRIRQAHEVVVRTHSEVRATAEQLARRRADVVVQVDALGDERERLLGAPSA